MVQNTTSSTRTFIPRDTVDKKPDKPVKKPRQSRAFKKSALPWIIITVLVVITGLLFWQYQEAQKKLSEPQQIAKYERQLRKIILLPADEKPITTATVKDATALSKILFYKNAKNGDVVFVFGKEHLAILYRPSTNQIINITTDVNISK